MKLFSALVSLSAAAFLPVVAVSQSMPTPDPACPPDTIVSTPLNMPNGTACVWCSSIMERCSASCSGPSSSMTCAASPDGCGSAICPGDDGAFPPPAPTPAPPPAPPTAGPVEPPPDVGTPEGCGIKNTVGCVVCGTGSDGKPDCGNVRGGVDGIDCNAFVPATGSECTQHIKYTYDVDVSAPPYNAIFRGAFRYRDGSYWEAQHGNPREFSSQQIGDDLTSSTAMVPGFVQYRMRQWEGEIVNLCLASSTVETTFQFKTSSESAGECAISDGYGLVTADLDLVAPMSASAGENMAEPVSGFTVSTLATASDGMDDAGMGDGTTTSPAAVVRLASAFAASAVAAVGMAM